MSISKEQLQSVTVGSQESRVEALRQILGYPVKQRDSQGSRFWFLRPGADEDEAEDTCPIAVGFYSELDQLSHSEALQFLTTDDQQTEIYGHYAQRIVPKQPVMYLLLPEGVDREGETVSQRMGRVAMVLPSEGKLRQRQIQTFAWTDQDLQARLNRLRQSELARTDRMQEKALAVIPLVEWAFYKPIETAKELAQKLAEVSRRIEQAIPAVYEAERQDGYLHTLLTSFQRELLPTLKLKADNEKDYSFADIYAQTIAYGLFTARVFSYTVDERKRREEQNPERKETDFNRQTAWELLPETNPFLRRLFKDVSQQPVEELGEDLVDAIAEVFSILRAAKMDAILADFRAKMNREDIVIRFYEDFLAAYKPKMRERRGVYYTPEPVVSYMVRSVDILLKEKFDKPLGLADPEVMILDPACGTGTFLLWIFQLIHQRFQENPDALTEGLEDRSWSGYVKERLLPRIFGFELLMAPYAIAHLKLGLFLEETGYQFDSGKRLGVYLTNSLEDTARKSETLFEEFIADEADQATSVKRDKPIMLMIGNPPYSISSSNKSAFIERIMEPYKKAVRSERNIQPLSDDYIKFICYAQYQIEKTGYGIIAYITNSSYLKGLVHRGMREEILKELDELYVLDIHGNSQIRERLPINVKEDQNVFDIQQGVAITIGIRSLSSSVSSKAKPSIVLHSDLWGSRSCKYDCLSTIDISSLSLKIQPSAPNFFFFPQNLTLESEYHEFISTLEIFNTYKNGIQTGHDNFAVDIEQLNLQKRLKEFYKVEIEDDELKARYELTDKAGWVFKAERKTAISEKYKAELLNPYFYRPFDSRWIYFSKRVLKRPVTEVMQHMLHENISLVLCRQQTESGFHHVFATNLLGDCNAISIKSREFNYYFPLYLYPETQCEQANLLTERIHNFSSNYLAVLRAKLGQIPTSETIFYYIYAVLHSPSYRTRYAEFLKIDFPRVPFTSNNALFRQLSAYGEELVALHLMKSPRLNTLATTFVDAGGDRTVDPGHPKYDESSSSILINKKGDKFIGVPKAVWEFYVGGYQVCQKWLKDRKGRILSEDDIIHYQRIVVALQETMCLMQKIDEAIPGFPIE